MSTSRKTERITVNVTPEEKELLDKRRLGRPWSSWIIGVLLEREDPLVEAIRESTRGSSVPVGVHRIAGTVDDPFPRVVSE